MKRIMVFAGLVLLVSEIFGQETIYGTVRTDGYRNVTKGASWVKRPEAKKIYEGFYPQGFEVLELTEDCFVRFFDGEHNSLDVNYIIFPKGEKIYKNKAGEWFAAMCGNKIEFWMYVNRVKIVEKISQPESSLDTLSNTQSIQIIINNYYLGEGGLNKKDDNGSDEIVMNVDHYYYDNNFNYYQPVYVGGIISYYEWNRYKIYSGRIWMQVPFETWRDFPGKKNHFHQRCVNGLPQNLRRGNPGFAPGHSDPRFTPGHDDGKPERVDGFEARRPAQNSGFEATGSGAARREVNPTTQRQQNFRSSQQSTFNQPTSRRVESRAPINTERSPQQRQSSLSGGTRR